MKNKAAAFHPFAYLAAFGISTLWFTVFIDAIAAVAAALVSILAFSGELYK